MDVELQMDGSSAAWAKYDLHFPPLPASSDPEVRITFDDSDGDDNSGSCFVCPFCYVEIEVRTIYEHLEEEHCFDMKNAICPVCAANFERDLIGHIMVQHSHLLKIRRRQKIGSSLGGLAVPSKDFEKLLLFLGVVSATSRTYTNDSTADESLSSSAPVSIGIQKSIDTVSSPSESISTAESDVNTSDRNELPNEEMVRRAEFYQELMFSTMF